MNIDRVYKKYTLQDLADELHMDVLLTWKLLNKDIIKKELRIEFRESTTNKGKFYYYLSDNQLQILTLKTDNFYN